MIRAALGALALVAAAAGSIVTAPPAPASPAVAMRGAGSIMIHQSPDDGYDAAWTVKCYPNGAQRALAEGQSTQSVCGSGAIIAFYVGGGTKIVCTDGTTYWPTAWHDAAWIYATRWCVNQLL